MYTYNVFMENTPFANLKKFYRSQKRMPSLGEFARLMGFKSRNAALKLAKKLANAGIIEKDETGRLLPGKLFYGIRILGTVEAGWPSPAEEELSDTMSLEEWLIGNKDATYMLKVKGDSMIDAGILPGDTVLVERTQNAKDGDIVIAEVDNEWTMKYLKKTGSRVYLLAANKKYRPILPRESLKITAVVKAVIRKY